MWQIIEVKHKVWITVGTILLVAFIISFFEQSWWRVTTSTVTVVAGLAWLFGKYLWKFIYIDFFKKNFCPDLNGKWQGKVISNYNENTEGKEHKEYTEHPITLEIEADFFAIKLVAKTAIGRSDADYCRVTRISGNRFELTYMFKTSNIMPTATDEQCFEGATKLIIDDPINVKVMKGPYWTNRRWQVGLNTAGIVEFEKL